MKKTTVDPLPPVYSLPAIEVTIPPYTAEINQHPPPLYSVTDAATDAPSVPIYTVSEAAAAYAPSAAPPTYDSLYGRTHGTNRNTRVTVTIQRQRTRNRTRNTCCAEGCKTLRASGKEIAFPSLLAIIPFAMLVIASVYAPDCPINQAIPGVMIAGGVLWFAVLMLHIRKTVLQKKENPGQNGRQNAAATQNNKCLDSIEGFFKFGLLMIFMYGSAAIFGTFRERESDSSSTKYCNAVLYYFGFTVLLIVYSCIGICVLIVILLTIKSMFEPHIKKCCKKPS